MPPSLTPPLAAAWLYMSDDQNYNTIPEKWSAINFKVVDVLLVGPAGIQTDGSFGLYDSTTTGPLSNRFKWVLQTARSQNPNIKIIISQWWGSAPTVWGTDLSKITSDQAIASYASSVQAFLQTWSQVSGGVDGFDIDYESANVIEAAPALLSRIRADLDQLSQTSGGRPFYTTVSPATTDFLGGTAQSLSYVNMQTYAGGMGLTPGEFTKLGLQPSQLLYGICPETNCMTKTVQEVEQEYTSNGLAGIHLWRLNSDNQEAEQLQQQQIYEFLHPSKK